MDINADALSIRYREGLVDTSNQKILITKLSGSLQENDLTKPVNCGGFGRIRHFRRFINKGWPTDPLPIDPACKALGMKATDAIEAQVFQIAGCNFRCWYCFVPFNLISCNTKHSNWLKPSELVDSYLHQKDPPAVIDLSGGQPDLAPEWVPWMMQELRNRGLDKNVYLWSDDNLSNDFFWKYLSKEHIDLVENYKNYGRVCCFKGFDGESFSFNTGANPDIYDRQFGIFKSLLTLNIDLYAYVTLTTPSLLNIKEKICRFVDSLQEIDEHLPLRTVPLKIQVFSPVRGRLNKLKLSAIENQQVAVEIWENEIKLRFPADKRILSIADVPLRGQ